VNRARGWMPGAARNCETCLSGSCHTTVESNGTGAGGCARAKQKNHLGRLHGPRSVGSQGIRFRVDVSWDQKRNGEVTQIDHTARAAHDSLKKKKKKIQGVSEERARQTVEANVSLRPTIKKKITKVQ